MNNRPLKIYIFCCSTTMDTDELIRRCREPGDDELKVISLPCSGKVDVLYLIKAFETGADGVVVVTCRNGECRYLEGNLRTRKRAEAVDSLLEEIGLGRGRMAIIQQNEGGAEQVIREVDDFCSGIRNLTLSDSEKSTPSHPADIIPNQLSSTVGKQ